VRRARAGETMSALRDLTALRERFPDDRELRIDTGIVALWAGEDAATVSLLAPLSESGLPAYARAALARSARNRHQWELALSNYAMLIEQEPAVLDHWLGRVYTLADADRFDEARAVLEDAQQSVSNSEPDEIALALGCGYVEERARRYTTALDCYHRVLALQPDHIEARRRFVLSASALGASDVALLRADEQPGLLDEDSRLRLELDAIALRIRWTELPRARDDQLQDDDVLAAQVELARQHPALGNLASATGRAFAFDRVAALVADRRMDEAIRQFEPLETDLAASGDVPAYAYEAAGRAYLYERRPERAEDCFRAALVAAPASNDARIGLFYALSDQNRYGEARTVAEALLASQAPWLHPDERTWLQNRDYPRARELVAMERAYRGRYAEALTELDEMLAVAPADASARLSRAEVYQWRGWYERAAREIAIADQADPDNVRATVAAGLVALDTQRFAESKRHLDAVVDLAGRDDAADRLRQQWDIHRAAEIVLSAEVERSRGSEFAGDGWRAEALVYSPPLRDHYRAFLHDVVRHADFEEGEGRDHRVGAGVEYRAHGITATGEVHRGFEQNEDAGASAVVTHRFGDPLTVEASLALNSIELPLRAVRAGVAGDTAGIGATYRWHERRAVHANASVGDFDDGNRRRSVGAEFGWRAFDAPGHALDAYLSADASDNSERDRPYFNPERDRTFTGGLTHDWQIHRRYDHGLTQRIRVEAGSYWQAHFGSGALWSVGVEHEWSLGARWQLVYGGRIGERPYDGRDEDAHVLFVTLRGRP